MSVIAIKSDYIEKANEAYCNLEEYQHIFEKEAYVISYAKCLLLQQNDLQDFYINGIGVNVYKHSNGYELYFDNYVIDIDVYDKQIVNYKISHI